MYVFSELFFLNYILNFLNALVRGIGHPRSTTGHNIIGELELNRDCFKIIICDILFMRFSRSKTQHCSSRLELWGPWGAVNTAVPPVKTLGEQSLLVPMIYATACSGHG